MGPTIDESTLRVMIPPALKRSESPARRGACLYRFTLLPRTEMQPFTRPKRQNG